MKIKTNWRHNTLNFNLEAEITIKKTNIYSYLATIESIHEAGISGEKVYIITDFLGEYFPEPGAYFWDKKFPKLKEAKRFVEAKAVVYLKEIVKQLEQKGK